MLLAVQVPKEQQVEVEESKKKGGNKKVGGTKKKQEVMSLKSFMLKLVPYISFPYAEHALRINGGQPNDEATEQHIPLLIKAANSCRDLVNEMAG